MTLPLDTSVKRCQAKPWHRCQAVSSESVRECQAVSSGVKRCQCQKISYVL